MKQQCLSIPLKGKNFTKQAKLKSVGEAWAFSEHMHTGEGKGEEEAPKSMGKIDKGKNNAAWTCKNLGTRVL